MKIALMFELAKPKDSIKEKMIKIANNTGNLIYIYALQKIFSADLVNIYEDDISIYDAIITTSLCWVEENKPIAKIEFAVDKAGSCNIPIIPISVGLAAGQETSDFSIHPELVKQLSGIAERSIIGVRGCYTAEVLNKHGIKNVQVIGCPSMYMHMDPDFVVRRSGKTPKNMVANFRTFWSKPDNKEFEFLSYAADNDFSFIEQTQKSWNPFELSDYYSQRLSGWLREKERIFFDVDEWRNYMRQFDFSMGHRLHGNIVGLWEGIPALFLAIDARMREVCDFFHLPHIGANEFDAAKPVEYYYRLADYTEFNRYYAACFNEFCSFIRKNHLPMGRGE